MKSIGLDLTKEEAIKAFSKMDKNGGGQVLFDEFCLFVRREIGNSLESGMRNNRGVPSIPHGSLSYLFLFDDYALSKFCEFRYLPCCPS
jgi:hypothetical protein